MATANELEGQYTLHKVAVNGKDVPEVEGTLIFSASSAQDGSFVSTSSSASGEQEESGTFLIDGDQLLMTVSLSTLPSMVGMVVRLKFRQEDDRLIMQHQEPGGREGDLVQVWQRTSVVPPALN